MNNQRENSFKNQPIKIVMIGMSYCAEWPLYLSSKFQIFNKGVNGDLTDGMVNRFEKDVLAEAPEYVLIWGFSNDITTGDRNKIKLITGNIKKNFHHIVEIARQNHIIPILGTQLTISYKKSIREFLYFIIGKLTNRQGYTDFANREIAALNNWLKIYAEENEILLLKLEEQLSNRWGFRQLRYTKEDGSHVTDLGYECLTAYAVPILTEYFSRVE